MEYDLSFAPNQQNARSVSNKGPTMEISVHTQSLYRGLSSFDLAINYYLVACFQKLGFNIRLLVSIILYLAAISLAANLYHLIHVHEL